MQPVDPKMNRSGADAREWIRQSFSSEVDQPPSPVQPCVRRSRNYNEGEASGTARGGAPKRLDNGAPGGPLSDQDLTWIEVVLVDPAGQPAAGVAWRVTTGDGRVYAGTLGETGAVRLEGIVPGDALITFPELDRRLWSASQ